MISVSKKAASIRIFSRVLVALFGGFLLSNLVAILISYYSVTNKVDAIVAGMMASFIVYTLIVMFVFSTKTARGAALAVFTACLVTYGIITYLEMVYI